LPLLFEWDEAKNWANIEKHGIGFRRAQTIFDGPTVSWATSRQESGEVRQITIGLLENTTVLTVVHTDRFGITRMISARPASRKERRRYEETL
jgi:uncharacterized protein